MAGLEAAGSSFYSSPACLRAVYHASVVRRQLSVFFSTGIPHQLSDNLWFFHVFVRKPSWVGGENEINSGVVLS